MRNKNCIIWLGLAIAVLVICLPVAAAPPKQVCQPPECYEPPPPPPAPPSLPESPPAAPPARPPWEGFLDGRLNPDMAEYYSVWCQDGIVLVLRGVPETALVDEIDMDVVVSLPDGGSLNRDSGLMVSRGGDTITLNGSNGNLATQPGFKTFSLSECLQRLGETQYTADSDTEVFDELEPLGSTDQSSNDSFFDLLEAAGQRSFWCSWNADLCQNTSPLGFFVNWLFMILNEICSGSATIAIVLPTGIAALGWRRQHKQQKR